MKLIRFSTIWNKLEEIFLRKCLSICSHSIELKKQINVYDFLKVSSEFWGHHHHPISLSFSIVQKKNKTE